MVKYIIIDTETTGLNIINDKPFLIQYGLVDEQLNLINTVVFDPRIDVADRNHFENLLQTIPTIVGHNIKFDIHMLINAGFKQSYFVDKNYIDTAVMARLVVNHDDQADKTFLVALKKLAVRYLGINSADEEHKLKLELARLVSAHKQKMKEYFINQGLWNMSLSKTDETKEINQIYNSWNKYYHLYPHLAQARKTFLQVNRAPTFEDCANVRTYAETDIKLTHGLFKLWYQKLVSIRQDDTLKRVSAAVWPLIIMERKGMSVDLKRVLDDRNKLLAELAVCKIIDPRNGEEIKIGQHAKLKELYEYESGMSLVGADKHVRNEIQHLSASAKIADYISNMNKYMTTYITGILNKMVPIGNEFKVFTDYNLAGTITGRLSGDFQQFPKEPLELKTGDKINIRSWFIVPNNDKYMFYFDYSQLELRLQCEWTNIVCGEPDLNMARAFSPYKCMKIGDKFYLEEDLNTEWKPVDLHGLTTKHAFPGIDETHPDWDHYRKLGKMTNFAVNYGASAPKIQEALKVDYDTALALVNGYKKAFPGVVAFKKWVGNRVWSADHIPNLFFRRYYSRNRHQLQNWLVQGSGADLLLVKLREVFNYIRNKPHWNFLITVHDEIGFTCTDIPEAQLRQEVNEIKELMSYSMSAVDVLADVEYTTTTWADKESWK
ncbi:MAG TPA: DNA polymerase [Acholeplasmataceae bacterium]|nr:DNA polymerase [Acholeplasmataceae bacterium]